MSRAWFVVEAGLVALAIDLSVMGVAGGLARRPGSVAWTTASVALNGAFVLVFVLLGALLVTCALDVRETRKR